MASNRKLRSSYLRWAKNSAGQSDTDIDFYVKPESFAQELLALKDMADSNGWLHLQIVENASPEGKGGYTHKIRVIG